MKTLVVDDDATIRRYLEGIIASQGYQVTSRPDAETAWKAYQRETHPLVILDWQLPGMDGLELCRMIRQQPKGDQSMIVMISVRNKPEDIQALFNAGADDFIPKPVDVEHLKLILRLGERQAKSLAERDERSKRLEIVEQIAKAVGSTLEPKELFQTIVREIRRAVPCEGCVISRMENGQKGFLRWHAESDSDIKVGPLYVREDELADWFSREVYGPKRAKIIPNLQNESLLRFKHLQEAGLGSLLLVPILQDDVSIAHIGLASKNPDAFTLQHMDLLTAISGHLGSAIRNATLFQTAEQRSSRLSTLQDLNRQIAENLNLPEVLENITSAAVELLRADFSQIFLVDEKSESLNLIKWHGHIPAPPRHELPLIGLESLGGKVTQKGKPIILPDVQKEDFWLEKNWARKYGIHSCIAQPLCHGEKIVGAINCLSRAEDLFDAEDLDLLGALSSQAAVAIENARLFEELERRGNRLATLVEVAQRLTRGLDLTDVLRTIAEYAALLFEADANIRLREGNDLVLITGTPGGLKINQNKRIPVGKSINGRVAESGMPFTTSDVSTVEELFPRHRENLIANKREAVMCIPLRLESQVLGTMTIFREKGYVFDEDAVRIATTLADQAAIAIENARLREEEKKSREFLNSVLDTAADAIITVDEDGTVESFNRAAEKMFGYHEREIIGRNISFLMPDPYRENHDGYRERHLKTGERFVIGSGSKITGKRRDGAIFPMELAVSEVRRDGQVKFTGIIRDITKREQDERALARLNQSLDEKNKDLETVFNVASHDLRSPLVNIQGYSKELSYLHESVRSALNKEEDIDALKRKLKVYLEEEIPEALQYISAGASKMDMLLSGFLRYSRLGYAALNIEPVDMNEMLGNISASMEYQIREAGAELEIGELPVCVGDVIQINQVFTNLLDNAMKYLDSSRPGTIRVSGKTEDGQAIYCVRDNGIGISKGSENKIFEIFQRLDNSAVSGEGLGLAITHRILDRLSGRIWLQSELGKGSDFYVSLPTGESVRTSP